MPTGDRQWGDVVLVSKQSPHLVMPHSHWLEVKMETDDSPDPDLSPSQSSPDLSSDGTHHLILTPPSAFADSSPQRRYPPAPPSRPYGTPTLLHNLLQATPASQIHGTPDILQNRGATFTIRDQASPSSRQSSSPQVPATSNSSTKGGDLCFNSTWTVGASTPLVVRNEAVAVDSATSRASMTSVLQRGTPSLMATASMINSTFGVRSPSSARRTSSSSAHRTPSLMVSDSLMGNSTFAVRSPSSSSSCSLWPAGSVSKHRTPSLLVTDSVTGHSTFAGQPVSSVVPHRTPSILVSNSVMGNSSMRTPPTPLDADVKLTKNQSIPTPLPPARSQRSTSTTNSLSWPSSPSAKCLSLAGSPACPPPQASAPLPPVIPERREEEEEEVEMMEVTPSPEDTMDDLADCRERMDSIRTHEYELKDELLGIKGQFFDLLDNLGLSHDIYYKAVTPSDTPSCLDPHLITRNVPVPADCLPCPQTPPHHRLASVHHNNNNLSPSVGSMTTPRHTPRRAPCGRHATLDVPSMYADLLIDQLLAQAQTDSDTSKSSSPPEVPDDPDQTSTAVAPLVDQPSVQQHGSVAGRLQGHAYNLAESVNINRGPADTPTKDSAKSKVIAVLSASQVAEERDRTLSRQSVSANDERGKDHEQTVTPEAPEPASHSVSSVPASSSSGSSSGRSVPDLDKELVSRMQYYSDFTIDRQIKIDKAAEMPEEVDENSPPISSDQSSETLSQRCVEGSETNDHFKRPVVPSKVALPAVPSRSSNLSQKKNSKHYSKSGNHSSDMCESDTSSGTGSMPRSQQSSRYSSQQSSRHSSRGPHSAYSSSGDHRSSSRGSRCSTHPLASSTLISDPSNSSPGSGSIYTWSLENSSDENLHQSFLRSEKKQRRRSRTSRRRSSTSRSSHSHRSTASHGASRPATLVGADSPPDEQQTDVGTSLHLTHMVSAIESPSRRFGGSSFENRAENIPTPRSASLPRTSTRLGFLLTRAEAARGHKASSFPELSNPTYPDLNCAVTRIGPSNLGSDLQHTGGTDGSLPPHNRPDLLGKSSTSGSATSYYSQCSDCNPSQLVSLATTSVRRMGEDDPYDEILTNSPRSYDSGGMQAPYNSYTSPAGSTNDYTTVSDSSPERGHVLASGPRPAHALTTKSSSSSVFKVPFSPASRTVRRKAGAGGRSTHNVGVRVVGTPHLPVGLLKNKEPVSRRKLFGVTAPAQSSGSHFHAPKILDRKALVRKFKKFSTNFKKDKDSAKIHTLANL